MKRTERHIVVESDCFDGLTHKAKNLYNAVNYEIRQCYFNTGSIPFEYELSHLFSSTNQPDFRALPAQTSQQIIKYVFKAWKAYFESLKEYKINPKKFKGKPKPPHYKDKDGHATLYFTNQQVKVKDGYLHFPKMVNIPPIKTAVSTPKQVRIKPHSTCFVVEIVFEKTLKQADLEPDSFVAIDLGLNNLATSINNAGAKPFIVNGRPLKSMNQYYNKKKSSLQSKLPEKTFISKQIHTLTHRRNNKVSDYLHKTSRFIVDYCVENRIGTIIIGKNEGWKDEINMGKRNNQNFVTIPHSTLIDQIVYKAEEHGILVEVTEESYTSKTDNLVLEPLKSFGDSTPKPSLGKRIKRGLFQSSEGVILNADVNGALGIGRKVVGDVHVSEITHRGVVSAPCSRLSF